MSEHLELVRTDTGNYRMYYRRGQHGTLCCVQNDGGWGKDRFVFYACSRDGEPSHEIEWPDELKGPYFSAISMEQKSA